MGLSAEIFQDQSSILVASTENGIVNSRGAKFESCYCVRRANQLPENIAREKGFFMWS